MEHVFISAVKWSAVSLRCTCSRAIQLQHNTPGYHGSHSVHLEYDVLVLELRVGGETEEQCVVIVLSICCTPLYDSVLTVSAFGLSLIHI